MLNSFSPQQINSILLWYLVQHSLSSFSKLVQHYGSVAAAVQPEHLLTWSDVRIHANHLQRAKEYLSPTGQLAFEQCLNQLQQQCDFVLTLDDEEHLIKAGEIFMIPAGHVHSLRADNKFKMIITMVSVKRNIDFKK